MQKRVSNELRKSLLNYKTRFKKNNRQLVDDIIMHNNKAKINTVTMHKFLKHEGNLVIQTVDDLYDFLKSKRIKIDL